MLRVMSILGWACVVALANPRATAAESQTYTIQYHFRAGEELRWNVRHEFQLETEIKGYEERAEGRADSVKAWHVESVSPQGHITLVHSVPAVQMWQKSSGRPDVTFDSQSGAAPPQAFAELAKNINKPLSRIVIDSHGNLISREDFMQLVEETKESDALIVPLPKEAISVGHSWSVRRDVKVKTQHGESTTVTMRRRFRLREVDGDRAFIEVETNVLSPVNDPTIKSQLIRDLARGEVIFDLDDGQLVERRLELDGEAIAFNGPASRMHYRGNYVEHVERNPTPLKVATSPDQGTLR